MKPVFLSPENFRDKNSLTKNLIKSKILSKKKCKIHQEDKTPYLTEFFF